MFFVLTIYLNNSSHEGDSDGDFHFAIDIDRRSRIGRKRKGQARAVVTLIARTMLDHWFRHQNAGHSKSSYNCVFI